MSRKFVHLLTGVKVFYAGNQKVGRFFVDALVAAAKLDNYLQMYRKRAGLTQGELAFLLGLNNGSAVSRHEKRTCLPPLHIALAYESILKVPISELFAGILESVEDQTEERARLLATQLKNCSPASMPSGRIAKKLRWLSECHSASTEVTTPS